MKNKIIIISVERLNEQTKAKYCINEFKALGHEVEYWFIGNLKVYFGEPHKLNTTINEIVHYFNDIDSVAQKLQSIQEKYWAIIQFPINHLSYPIISALYNTSAHIIMIDLNYSLSQFGATFNRTYYWYKNIKNPKLLIYNLASKKARKRLLKHNQYYNIPKFTTGNLLSKDLSLTFNDYNVATNLSDEKITEEKYAVFIDQSLPNHPDLKNLGLTTLNPQVYYRKMNKFFDELEKKFNLKVIIAAHPKSNISNEYNTRKVIKGKTASLIKYCEVVLNHYSSAISFVAYFEKPMLYIYMDEFYNKKTYLFEILNRMETQSKFLNVPMVNIDHTIINDLKIPTNTSVNYKNFNEKYIKAAQYPLSNFEILYQYLNTQAAPKK